MLDAQIRRILSWVTVAVIAAVIVHVVKDHVQIGCDVSQGERVLTNIVHHLLLGLAVVDICDNLMQKFVLVQNANDALPLLGSQGSQGR